MTRKQLEDLELSKEQVDTVMSINGGDIENAKTTANAEVTSLKAQVKERDTQLETLKTSVGDADAMKQQIADLQSANETAKTNHESEMNQLKLNYAVESTLSGAKAKNNKAVKALLDLEGAKFDKDGNVKGLQEQIDTLVAGDDTKFLFDTQQPNPSPQFKGFQPGASSEQKPGVEVDMSKMTYDQLEAYMNANPETQV
ncbi:MAG: phage scaffolding protein [Lachnospiraceae bacterium]